MINTLVETLKTNVGKEVNIRYKSNGGWVSLIVEEITPDSYLKGTEIETDKETEETTKWSHVIPMNRIEDIAISIEEEEEETES